MTKRDKQAWPAEAYFRWLCDQVDPGGMLEERLLRLLQEVNFTYILERDGNRAEDGKQLRFYFAYERRIPREDIPEERPCTMLEMLVGVSRHCEAIGCGMGPEDTTGYWFWRMLESLGLLDARDEAEALDILERFFRRAYEPNGRGGIFTLKSGEHDMRKAEIWWQMMWWLREQL